MLIRVDGCEMYSGICGCRLLVYVYFYVRATSDDSEVVRVGVTVGFYCCVKL